MRKLYSIERKSAIIDLLGHEGKVSVENLAQRFGTSKETIRRDLHDLEKEGVLKRTHGGAIPKHVGINIPSESVETRSIRYLAEKNLICRAAAAFIADDDMIFIDNSSTTSLLARYIPAEKRVTVVTNSVHLLVEASHYRSPKHTYICLGGYFEPSNLCVHGTLAMQNATEYYPNKMFMSCDGVSPESQIADSSIQATGTKRLMIERSKEVFLLVDHSKFTKSGQLYLTNIGSVHRIITDPGTRLVDTAFVDEAGGSLLIAD